VPFANNSQNARNPSSNNFRQVNTVRQTFNYDSFSDEGSQSDQEDSKWDFDYENPRPSSRRPKRRNFYQAGNITDDERDPSPDQKTVFAFPIVTKKEKSPARKPYTKRPSATKTFPEITTQQEPTNPPSFGDQMDIPFSESMAEDAILGNKVKRGPRQYKYDPWRTIGQLNAGISIHELAQLSPAVRSSLQHGLRDTKPMYGAVNSVELSAKTPAYATGKIGGQTVSIIIDTGAGICLMSKKLLKKLG
jgi:hypothetical protein